MTDDEIDTILAKAPQDDDGYNSHTFARAIIAAYQAKLLAGVKLPEPSAYGYANERIGMYGLSLQKGGTYTEPDRVDLYTKDQLQQYAAAAAAQAREKALDEAKGVCEDLPASDEFSSSEKTVYDVATLDCAAAIEQLKVKP